MRNVDTNCSRPNSSATLMLPTSLMLMKPRAYADSSTYSAYQRKNATVIGKTKRRSIRRSRTKSSDRCTARYLSVGVVSVDNGAHHPWGDVVDQALRHRTKR